jgi:hypothetical protein
MHTDDWINLNSIKGKYQKSRLTDRGKTLRNNFLSAIEPYFIKAVFDNYQKVIRIKPNTLYKSTKKPYITFKLTCIVCEQAAKSGIY